MVLAGNEVHRRGEGIDRDFGLAFAKSQLGAGVDLPLSGKVFVSVRDEDKDATIESRRILHEIGFEILATGGTTARLNAAGVPASRINKVMEGRSHAVDAMLSGDIQLVFNTAMGAASMRILSLASHCINEQNSVLHDGIRQSCCRAGHSGHAKRVIWAFARFRVFCPTLPLIFLPDGTTIRAPAAVWRGSG